MFKKSISYIGIYLIIFNIFSSILFLDTSNAEQITPSIGKKESSTKGDLKNYSEDRVLVKFKQNTGLSKIQSIQNNIVGTSLSNIDFYANMNIGVLSFNKNSNNIEGVISELKKNRDVEYVEYDYIRKIDYVGVDTNDTDSIEQWYLKSIQADEAWKIYNDTENKITVSVNDTGIDYTHSDLAGNLKDLSTNCKSDTGVIISGGCPNSGWNFEGNGDYNSATAILAENDIYDINGHGTHVTGIIGAVGNNGTGIIGTTQNIEIIGARVETYENDYALFYVSNTIRALNFAVENGAKVVNASYGGTSYSQAEYDAINNAKSNGVLMVVAAGNNATDNDGGTHFYPSDYDLDNIISVASLGNDDTLAYYSNYGITSVDIAAPGGDTSKDSGILSTYSYYETIWEHNMDSFSGITLTGTGLSWNIYNGLFANFIESQSGAYMWNSTYTGSEDKSLIFDNTFDLSGAKFAKFDGYFECQMALGDDLEILINDQIIGNSNTKWTYSRANAYGNVVLPIPSNLYTSGSQLKVRFISNSDTNIDNGCSLDDFKIIRYDDNKNHYNSLQGTSMAAPVVTGIATMLWSYKPELTYLDIKDIIFSSLDILSNLNGKILTSGKINAKNAIKELISKYGVTKNGIFEGETFNVPNINLNGKNINLSGSILNLTSTGNVISLSGSVITGSGIIKIGTGTSIDSFSTTNDFDLLIKDQSGTILNYSGGTIYGESLTISYTGSFTGTGLNVKLNSGAKELYNNQLINDLSFNINDNFSGAIDSYVYKNGDELNGISTGVVLEVLNKTSIAYIDFQYTPSVFTGTLNFASGSATSNTGIYIDLNSTHYPVTYEINGDIIGTYTGTLNNSGSVLLELSEGDGIKNISGVLENLNGQFSTILTGSIILDQNPAIITLNGSGIVDIELGSNYSDLGAFYSDIIDGTGSITASGLVNINLAGSYDLTYNYTDTAGNISNQVIRTINVLDVVAPTGGIELGLIINNTGALINLFSSEYPVNYEITGDLIYTVTGTLNNSGTVDIILNSGDGLKNISVNFIDLGNNISPTYTGSIILDKTAPLINILSHSNNEIVTSSFITLTGTVFDTNSIDYLEINGILIYLNSGNFLSEIDLNLGNNIINYTGSDIAGNITSGAINIFRDILDYNIETFTGNLVNTGSVLFSGSGTTSSGVLFNSTGTLDLYSSDGNNNVVLSLSGLTINSSGWDLVFNPPEQIVFSGSFTNTGYTHLETLSYDIGNSDVELILTGALAEVKIFVGTMYNGQSLGVFRSANKGVDYNYLINCLVSDGICSFNTDQFSLFTIATPSDSIPDNFTFIDIINSELSTDNISNTITVSGINTGSIVSISNGIYSINSGIYTSIDGLVYDGDTINIKLFSSSINSTIISSILTIGGISSIYNITTKPITIVSSGGGGGGGGSSYPTCLDTQLICKGVAGSKTLFKWYKKEGFTCVKGNLGKECSNGNIVVTKQLFTNLKSIKELDSGLAFQNKVIEKIFNDRKKNLINTDEILETIEYLGDDITKEKKEYRYLYFSWIESIKKVENLLFIKNIDSLRLEFKNFLNIYSKLEKYKEKLNTKSIIINGKKIYYLKYSSPIIDKIQIDLFNKISKKEYNIEVYKLANKVTHNLNILLTDKSFNADGIKLLRVETISLYKEFLKEYNSLDKKNIIKESIADKIKRINEEKKLLTK